MPAAGWQPLTVPPTPPRPAFARLAATHALSMAGDALVTLALAGSLFFSISPNEARGRVMLSLVLTMAPFAVVAPFLGPAIDRSRQGRRSMVGLSCAGRAAACLLMTQVLQGLLLFPAAFTVLVFSKAYSVARSSLVPSAVDHEHELVEANAKLSITGVLAGFAAAIPGVALLQFADARWVLGLAAVVFVAGLVTSFRLVERRDEGRQGQVEGDVEVSGRAIVLGASAMALLRAVVGFLTFLVAFAFRRVGAPTWWFGGVLAASLGGTFVAAVVAPRLRRRLPEEQMLVGSLAAVAVVAGVATQLVGGLWAAAVAAVVGIAAAAGKLAFDAIIQRDAPEAVRGRSFARFEAGFQLLWVVGALLPVVVPTPLQQGFGVISLATTVAAFSYALVPHLLTRSGL